MANTTAYQAPSQVVPFVYDPALSRGVRAFLTALNGNGQPALETLPVPAARQALAAMQAAAVVDLSGIEVAEKTIEQDGLPVKLHLVRPAGTAARVLPVFVFVPGGGWVLGDFATHQRLVRDLVVASGYAAAFVNYTPSPEARYPQALHEVYAATKWVAAHGADMQVDGTRLAVVGNGVGATLATATCLLAKEQGGPTIRCQLLFWPLTDAYFEYKSYQLYAQDRFLTTALMRWLYDQYLPNPAERAQVYASPLHATPEQLRGLPPTLIQVAANDILRDGGEAYGRHLDAAGVPTTTVRYDGMIHDFGLLNALAGLPQVTSFITQAAAELRKHLGA